MSGITGDGGENDGVCYSGVTINMYHSIQFPVNLRYS